MQKIYQKYLNTIILESIYNNFLFYYFKRKLNEISSFISLSSKHSEEKIEISKAKFREMMEANEKEKKFYEYYMKKINNRIKELENQLGSNLNKELFFKKNK